MHLNTLQSQHASHLAGSAETCEDGDYLPTPADCHLSEQCLSSAINRHCCSEGGKPVCRAGRYRLGRLRSAEKILLAT